MTSSPMPALRVGVVNYLNSRPLAWGLLQARDHGRFAVSCHPPARVAELLAEGAIDVGLVPSIEIQRIPGLRVVPGLCVAATEEVRSVLLVSRRPVADLRRIAVDENSRTSAALVRILLEDLWGTSADLEAQPPDVERMLTRADAALVIGDPALRVDRGAYRIVDLAAAWRRLTGLPFVFAVWAVAPEVEERGLAARFHASLEAGRAALGQIVARAADQLSLPPSEIEGYLTSNLRFTLGEEERAGLEEFFRRAEAKGLIPERRPVELYEG